MTGLVGVSGLVAGFITGWLLRTVFVLAQISWSQERMQRKVRYWQSEAAYARDVAAQLDRRLAACPAAAHEPGGPPSDNG